MSKTSGINVQMDRFGAMTHVQVQGHVPAPTPVVKFCQVKVGAVNSLPKYATVGSAGMDLVADADAVVPAGGQTLVGTGLKVAIAEGYEGQVRSRSGLATKFGVFVLNSPGTIDCDYRGEIKVILFNLGANNFRVNRGDRIAQLIIAPVVSAKIEMVNGCNFSGDVTARGNGGFGSTGGYVEIA